MRRRFLFAAGLVVGLSAAVSALATEPAVPTYLVSITLHDGDRLVGEPRLKVRAGETSKIEIHDAEGHGVSMSLVARPQPDSAVGVTSMIEVISATGLRRAVNPTLVIKLGKPAGIAFGEDSATQAPFRVDLTVTQVAA